MSLFKAPLATMVESINLLNGQNLVASEYIFGTPTAITPVGDRNTSILVTAKNQQSAYAGEVTFAYRRRDLSELASQVKLTVPVRNPTSTLDIINAMNKMFGMVLTADEIVIRPLTDDEKVENAIVNIQATDTAMAWLGNVDVATRVGGYPLADYLKNIRLNGLNYPTPTTSRPYAHFYSYPRNFSLQYTNLAAIQVGTGQMDKLLAALIAETGDAWVASGVARYSLGGATVTKVGLCADFPGEVNPKYDAFVKVQLDLVNCLGLSGEMTLHYYIPDPNS